MRLLLDTDVFIEFLRQRPDALAWVRSLSEPPLISGVAALEVSFAARSMAESREIARVIGRSEVLWPTDDDMRRATVEFATLRLAHGIGALDAVSAAQALRLGVPLVTFNERHFRVVPGLTTVQPYTR